MIKEKSILYLRIYLFFMSAMMMVTVSFLPLYFKDKGLSSSQIGWFLAIGPFVSLIAQPFWGYVSDKFKTVKKVLVICLVGTVINGAVLFQMSTFKGIMLVGILFFLALSPLVALGDNLAQKTSIRFGISFGSIRTYGAIGFAAASLICGQILSATGTEYVFYLFLIFSTVSLLLCLKVSDVPVSNKPVNIADAVKLLSDKRLLMFCGLIMIVTLTHRTNDSFLALFIQELGGNEALVGQAWFLGVISEAVVFATSVFWFRRFHELTFILMSSILFAIRWMFVSMADDPGDILMLQVLHGINFGVIYLGSLKFLMKLVPKELQATGHLLFMGICFGLAGGIGSLLGGMILNSFGGTVLYQCLSYSALLGSVGLLIFSYCHKKSAVKLEQAIQEQSV